MCEELRSRLSTVKLKDPEIRSSREFWRYVTRFTNSFIALITALKEERNLNRQEMSKVDVQRILKPVHIYVKTATANIRESPWAYIFDDQSPPPTAISTSSSNWPSGNGTINGQLTAARTNGYQRKHGNSISSPYVPTTPLSAALGPAAQATVPNTARSSNFDRSFQGDVFQRADSLLTLQPGLIRR